MKGLLGIASAVCTLATCVSASTGYLSFPINKKAGAHEDHLKARTEKLLRAAADASGTDYVSISLKNEQLSYYSIDVAIGTPQQQFTLLIDTGSSDLWVLSSSDPYCTQNGPLPVNLTGEQFDCSDVGGTYSPSDSSTYHYNNSEFYITYGDYTFAEGDWGTDTVVLSDGTVVTDLSVAIGYIANSSVGVFGIGIKENEATDFMGNASYTYLNLPYLLKEQGDIASNAYSLYLDDANSETGTLLFGAVDSSKYTGGLWTVPLVNYYASYGYPQLEFTIMNDKIVYNEDCVTSETIYDTPYFGLLDSGTTYALIPNDAYNAIVKNINATYDDRAEDSVFACDDVSDIYLTYYFSGVPINVNLTESIYGASDSDGNALYNDAGQQICGLLMAGVSGDYGILGDAFLRGAYIVYDIDNLEVSLGQADYSSDTSNLELILSSVPGASPASEYVATSTFTSVCAGTSTSAASSTSATANSTTIATTTGSGFSNSSSATTLPSATLSTQTFTSVSGTLTITGTSVITVCPVCEGKTETSATPVASVEDIVTVTTSCSSTSFAVIPNAAGSTLGGGGGAVVPVTETSATPAAIASSEPSKESPSTSGSTAKASVETSVAVVASVVPVTPESAASSVPVAEGSAANVKPLAITAIFAGILGVFLF